MDSLPKNAAGKVLRVRFADRASLPRIDEDTSSLLRLFEGKSPPQGTSLTTPLQISPVEIKLKITENFLEKQSDVNQALVVLLDLPSHREAVVAFVTPSTVSTETLQEACRTSLHAYLCPYFIYPTDELATIANTSTCNGGSGPSTSSAAYQELIAKAIGVFTLQSVVLPRSDIERDLERIWREQLMFERAVSVTSSFFELGGDSLRAGVLVNAIRKEFGVGLTVADLFTSPTIEGMAHRISFLRRVEAPHGLEAGADAHDEDDEIFDTVNGDTTSHYNDGDSSSLFQNWEYSMKHSSTSLTCLIIQLIPFAVIFPVRRLSMWFLIATPWVMLMSYGVDRFPALIMAMVIMRAISETLFPLIGVVCKWLIVGKYTAGRYPLWGTMYLKWWLVEQIVKVLGVGIYRDDFPLCGPFLVRFYYTLMVSAYLLMIDFVLCSMC
jgi:acyl carrier protein